MSEMHITLCGGKGERKSSIHSISLMSCWNLEWDKFEISPQVAGGVADVLQAEWLDLAMLRDQGQLRKATENSLVLKERSCLQLLEHLLDPPLERDLCG